MITSVQIGKKLSVKIDDLNHLGNGVSKTVEHGVIWVPFTVTGDLVEIEIEKKLKSGWIGRLLRVVESSAHRVAPLCSFFGVCGGCQLQHVDYSYQWRAKIQGLGQAMKRNRIEFDGVIDEFPANEPYQYRSRCQFEFRNGEAGMFGPGSHSWVSVNRCEIADEKINEWIFSRSTKHFSGDLSGSIEVRIKDGVVSTVPREMADFSQVNLAGNLDLISWMKQHIGEGDQLLDLYGGSGNFADALGDRFTFRVCVDNWPCDLKSNTEIQFIHSDVGKWLAQVKSVKLTTMILDPPRSGLAKVYNQLSGALERLRLKRVCLVGCDPISWSRDVRFFESQGWKLKNAAVFDFFPQTKHFETAGIFEPIIDTALKDQ